MKKSILTIVISLLAITISSCQGRSQKITYGEALAFAKENHDPHQYDGYNVKYLIKTNDTAISKIELFKKTYTDLEKTDYYIEKVNDVMLDLAGLESELFYKHTININSAILTSWHESIRAIDTELGYFDYGFSKTSNHIGYYINSNHFTEISNVVGNLLNYLFYLIGETAFSSFIATILSSLTTSESDLAVDIETTRFGFIDYIDLSLNLKDGFVNMPGEIPIPLFACDFMTFKEAKVNLRFSASYSIE